VECGGLVYPVYPELRGEPLKGRRFSRPLISRPSEHQARQRDIHAQNKSPEAFASGPCQFPSLRELQVKEDAHNERKQRQCLHEYQTQ